MREWQSQTHVKWYCRYHVVIVPKYRRKSMFGAIRKDVACPAAGDLARLRALWAAAAEQRLPAANAAHAVWGDPLVAAGGAVSEGLLGLAGCAVGSSVGVGVPPTHGGGSTVDGLSVGSVCTV